MIFLIDTLQLQFTLDIMVKYLHRIAIRKIVMDGLGGAAGHFAPEHVTEVEELQQELVMEALLVEEGAVEVEADQKIVTEVHVQVRIFMLKCVNKNVSMPVSNIEKLLQLWFCCCLWF